MSQSLIGKILKSNFPEYLTYQNIMEQSGLSKASVSRTLRVMKRRMEIEYQIVKGVKPRAGWVTIYRINGGHINGSRKDN